jgi:hypothetical protein
MEEKRVISFQDAFHMNPIDKYRKYGKLTPFTSRYISMEDGDTFFTIDTYRLPNTPYHKYD